MLNQNIGAFIASLRKERGLTQEQLAEKLGVSNRSISRWENGNTLPDFSLMQSLSAVLDISMAELLNGQRSDSNDRLENSISIALELSQKVKDQQRRQLNLRFGCGFAFLLLALLYKVPGIPAVLPSTSGAVLFWFYAAIGLGFVMAGFHCNNKMHPASKSRIAVLATAESDLRMRTADEMLQFSMKYQCGHQKQHTLAFTEIARNLQNDEYAVFSFIGSSCSADGNPGPWHIGVAITNKRLLLSGETMKGCMLPVFPVQSYDRTSLRNVHLEGSKLILCVGDTILKLEGTDFAPIISKLKRCL